MQYTELLIDRNYDSFNAVDFGFHDCKPSHHFGPAVRSYWLLHYVTSGFGRFEKEGRVYNIQPGQIFVIPPHITTYYEADDKKPWNYIWIGFTSSGTLPMKLPDVITAPELGTLFEGMKQCSKMDNGKESFLSAKIWEMFSILLEQTKQSNDWIDVAISFMNNNYHNPINISEVAQRIGFDRSYFSSAFKKKKGITPQQYLLNVRMEKAADIMLNSGVKPSVAAKSVGYEDLFVFSKTFKKHFGVSPRQYVKENA